MTASLIRRLFLATFVVAVASLAAVQAATAGTYTVYGCHIYGQPTHDLGAYDYPHYNAWDDCAAGRELNSVAEVNTAYGYQEEGGWAANAPAGTTFRHVEVNAREQLYSAGGGSGLVSAGYVCWSRNYCNMNQGSAWLYENGTTNPMLGVGNAGNGQWGSYRNYQFNAGAGAGADVAHFGFFCGLFTAPGAPCTNYAGDKRWLKLSSFTFIVDDPYQPNAPSVGGTLGAGGWKRGVVDLGGTASDTGGGVSLTRFSLGSAAVTADFAHSCDRHPSGYNRLQACPTSQNYGFAVDTTRVADGAHPLQVWSIDASGAEGPRTTQTVYVDNTAPAAPTGVAVVGGDGWRSTRSFGVSWSNPGGQNAPIAAAHWQLCRTGGSCTTGTGAGINSTNVQVPDQSGDYTLRLRLEDAAGNSDAANLSDPVHLRYDSTPPGDAVTKQANGWIDAIEASDYPLPLDLAVGSVEPVSGIAGYSVTTDGSAPDATIEAPGRRPVYRITSLPEGVFTIKSRAVSGAGVPSVGFGTSSVKVDRTPPSTALEGAPDPAQWGRGDANLVVSAVDQAHLSGMTPAPAGAQAEDGGYVAYRLDGGPVQRVKGDRASLKVGDDGHHALTYYAVDFAGNVSPERTAEFKIDRTAPETVGFESQDPTDPRRLSVLVEDRLSGVASGQVAARASSGGSWTALPTTLSGNRLVARIDDGLPDGTYEYIVTVRDRAGNERTTDRRMDGSKMELHLPLRLGSQTTIAAATSPTKRCPSKGKQARTPNERCTAKQRLRGSVSLKVGFRKRAHVVGRVETTDHRAIPNAPIDVEAVDRIGGPVRTLGHTRASAGGEFTFTLPAGPSRTIRFVYQGDNIIKASAADARTRVPAAVRLEASRAFARNGDSVVFRGSLVSRPIPRGGKVVSLQARVPGGWRTFAGPKTDRRGRFSYRYKFTATTGLQRYAIRALVQRDASYSYENGVSKPVVVRVRGR